LTSSSILDHLEAMAKQAVLLVNLGSPCSTDSPDVRAYLKEFLSDRRVFDAPSPIREYVLFGKILPFRPKKTSAAYQRIWTPEGAPLMVISRKVQALLQAQVDVPVALAMRYQNPSIRSVLQKLAEQGVEELFLIPLYPHYAMSSYETVVVKVREDLAEIAPRMQLDVLPPFYAEPDYIDALVESAEPYLEKGYDHIVFSFHGVPERHLRKGDPSKAHCTRVPDCCRSCSPVHEVCYRAQCIRTVDEFVKKANIPPEKHTITFQSRLGKEPWLEPYTDEELERLGQSGDVKKLLIICPAFVSDCLETLEEIAMEGKHAFLEAGGEEFTHIPCMNDHPAWIEFLRRRVESFLNRERPEVTPVPEFGAKASITP
jgi:protoporphyrin/coproporphyrin ferrochelatase